MKQDDGEDKSRTADGTEFQAAEAHTARKILLTSANVLALHV